METTLGGVPQETVEELMAEIRLAGWQDVRQDENGVIATLHRDEKADVVMCVYVEMVGDGWETQERFMYLDDPEADEDISLELDLFPGPEMAAARLDAHAAGRLLVLEHLQAVNDELKAGWPHVDKGGDDAFASATTEDITLSYEVLNACEAHRQGWQPEVRVVLTDGISEVWLEDWVSLPSLHAASAFLNALSQPTA